MIVDGKNCASSLNDASAQKFNQVSANLDTDDEDTSCERKFEESIERFEFSLNTDYRKLYSD